LAQDGLWVVVERTDLSSSSKDIRRVTATDSSGGTVLDAKFPSLAAIQATATAPRSAS
jgi:hypothetical protein